MISFRAVTARSPLFYNPKGRSSHRIATSSAYLSSDLPIRERHFWSIKRVVCSASATAAALVAVVLFVQGCVLESFYVPSSSMVPTLNVDDCIVVPKLRYGLRLPFVREPIVSWGSPERGRVVVFHREDDPSTRVDESARALVKRVIGLEGDTITLIDSQVFVNGELLREPYARWKDGGIPGPVSFSVPAGSLFLLGDNRDESYDSRFWKKPFVPVSRVLGPASAVYWSANSNPRMVY
ncbi:MAG: signal peptidase I [Pseudomonadota bacterium]|jgi:signal peptidase I